jgi:AraC family transcriptional regulator, transcriptional activator of pobA
MATSLPLFHLDADAPAEQTFDFIHIETIASRAASHQWTVRAHRHRNLFQILLIERGGGEMTFETTVLPLVAPAAILLAPATAHGFRFQPDETDGWVVSFTADAAQPLGERGALARLTDLAADPTLPLAGADRERLSRLCAQMHEESVVGREGFRLAMRGLLALLAVEIARLAASRARTGVQADQPADATVVALRRLVEEHFRRQRLIGFYAQRLGMTPDRLNDHLKRALGVTAGHLIRQRVLTEAKHQLVFTTQPIQDISDELAFFDQSHFARFFRKQTGMTPQEFRERAGG